jgi:uncharacterized membrane protein YozB (DUF420 family)
MRKYFLLLMMAAVLSTAFSPLAASVIIPASSAPIEPDPAKMKEAAEYFKNLPRKEKMQRLKQAKKEIKGYRKAKKAGKEVDSKTILLVILAIFVPPLAVYLLVAGYSWCILG